MRLGDDEAELPEQAAQGVDVGGPRCNPARAEAVQAQPRTCCETDFTGTGRMSAFR